MTNLEIINWWWANTRGAAAHGAMKRIGPIAGMLLILSVAGLILYEVWPKYGFCPKKSRYDEIACTARRNLHFSAHFTWSFNRSTVEAVMSEVSREDIPVLAECWVMKEACCGPWRAAY